MTTVQMLYEELACGYALELLVAMVNIGLVPCVVTYNSLLNSYCRKNGRIDDELALFREMLGRNVKLCAIT
jgi:pentatricopeptide repeat protein